MSLLQVQHRSRPPPCPPHHRADCLLPARVPAAPPGSGAEAGGLQWAAGRRCQREMREGEAGGQAGSDPCRGDQGSAALPGAAPPRACVCRWLGEGSPLLRADSPQPPAHRPCFPWTLCVAGRHALGSRCWGRAICSLPGTLSPALRLTTLGQLAFLGRHPGLAGHYDNCYP